MIHHFLRLAIIFIFTAHSLFCQTITGTIADTRGKPLVLANVVFKEGDQSQSIKEFVQARNGKFTIILGKKYTKVLIEVIAEGYFGETKTIETLENKTYQYDFVLAKDEAKELKEVVIVAEKSAVIVKKDTLEYNVAKFRDGSERKIEDIIKKLPGISVNDKTGEIKYNGKSVETVTLDGDNMFGYNYSLGTKNINVDMVEQVQAIDNYSENPLLKGIEKGDKVSLNLKLKKGKSDTSGNIEFGLGANAAPKLLNNTDAVILQVSQKYKALGSLSYNNIGLNNSPFDYFSGNQNIEQIKSRGFETYKIIPETLFPTIIDNTRTNNNNLIFLNYNNLFKINHRISVKTNLYYLSDNINFQESSNTTNTINTIAIATSDQNVSNKKPSLYRGDVELKFNTSKNSLLEYKTKLSFEETHTSRSILANRATVFFSNLSSKNELFNQNLIFTQKLSDKKVIQVIINQGFNDIPQVLSLNTLAEINSQASNFKKTYLSTAINLLATTKAIKYSFSLGANTENTPFVSTNNNMNGQANTTIDKNETSYSKQSLYQLGSINYTIKNWTISPSYGLKILNQALEDNILNKIEQKTDLIFEPSLGLKYKINGISFVTSRIGIAQNPILDDFLFRNPIITSNRYRVSNTPSLALQKSTAFSIYYNYNNIQEKLLLELGLNYQKNKGNFYADYTINQTETRLKNVFLFENKEYYNADIVLVKYLPIVSALVKLKTNYAYATYFNFLNASSLRENRSDVLMNELSVKTSFKSKINLENTFVYTTNKNKTNGFDEIMNKSFINTAKLIYKQSKQVLVALSSNYYVPATDQKENDYLFLDASVAFKPKNKLFELSFNAKNLMNKQVFSQVQTSDFSKSIFQINLIPRYIFCTVAYKL